MNNLLINAVQAMPDGGTVTIEARNVALAADYPVQGLKCGPYVEVQVIDEGVGIATEALGMIFDPYYTTRSNGNGHPSKHPTQC